MRRTFAGLFLGLLAAIVIGCGKTEPPVAQNRDQAPAETTPATPHHLPPLPSPLTPMNPLQDSVIMGGAGSGKEEGGRLKREVHAKEAYLKEARRVVREQETLRARTDGKGDPGKVARDPKDDAQRPFPAPAGEFNQSNAEKYGTYRENEFRSPQVAALSTFSADVNTASYSNVRRFLLDQHQLPVKDAVFLAEFVNYFPYSYAKPKGDDPIAFHLELGPCPWDRTHHLVRIGVQARQIDPEQMPPRNLVFLIDTSGSMNEPNRLPLVQKSLGLLIDRLAAQDTVSIVTYAGDSRIALGPTKGTEKEKIRGAVDSLSAHGSTNGEGGIKTAYDLATRTFIDGGVNRVILCTDGDFNVGVPIRATSFASSKRSGAAGCSSRSSVTAWATTRTTHSRNSPTTATATTRTSTALTKRRKCSSNRAVRWCAWPKT